MGHACMKKVGNHPSSGSLICDMLKFRDWQIAEKGVAVVGCLKLNSFRYVANGKINRIGRFVSKYCYLSFVRRDNDRDYCSTWFS